MSDHTSCRIMLKRAREEYNLRLLGAGKDPRNAMVGGVHRRTDAGEETVFEITFRDGFFFDGHYHCAYEAKAHALDHHCAHVTGFGLMGPE